MDRLLSTAIAVDEGDDRTLEAFAWGLLSASSLVFGAIVGVVKLPSTVVRAAMMAFGGGALIEALSIELFAHLLAKARGGHGGGDRDVDRPLVFLALVSALCGGLVFAGLDRALSNHGAFLRKAATVQAYVGRLRYALTRRLINRLQQVPMFEVLPMQDLHRLARSMVKERYATGAVIFTELRSDSSVFFLLSGKVELKLTTRYTRVSGPDDLAIADEQPPGAEVYKESVCETPREVTEEVTDRFKLGANDIFGEMALFSSETVQAQAVATAPSCVLRIPSAALHRLLASNRRLQDFVAMMAIDRLRETEVFCRCTPSTVARLVSFMKQAEFEAGDSLFSDIDGLCPIYFVVLGRVEVSYALPPDAEGGDMSLNRRMVCANQLLGTEHLVTGKALAASAVAMERTTVLIVQRGDIDKLCEHDKRFRQAVLQSGSVGAQLSGLPVDFVPPEGMSAPSKFGGAFAELGWRRSTTKEVVNDGQGQTPITVEVEAPPSGAPTPPSGRGKGTSCASSEPSWDEDLLEEVGDDPFKDDFLATQDLPDLMENANAAKGGEGHDDVHGHSGHGRGVQAAIMIWLGILIDSIPESVVMGILVNTATRSTLLTFVCGVFLANFPEAMSSAGTMYAHGMRKISILTMWASITLTTAIGAYVGALVFPPGSAEDPVVAKVIASIEGLCGGAMLCMIANTVLPEAFEQGGNVTGLSALLGFLLAIAISVI